MCSRPLINALWITDCTVEVKGIQMSIDITPSTENTGAVSSTSGKDDIILGWDTEQEKYGLAPLTEIQKEALKILMEKFSGMDGLGMVLDSACYQRFLR